MDRMRHVHDGSLTTKNAHQKQTPVVGRSNKFDKQMYTLVTPAKTDQPILEEAEGGRIDEFVEEGKINESFGLSSINADRRDLSPVNTSVNMLETSLLQLPLDVRSSKQRRETFKSRTRLRNQYFSSEMNPREIKTTLKTIASPL